MGDGTSARGMSLHIGLDRVDPAHYKGWSGRLYCAENDARSMARIATGEGFAATVLLSEGASRQAFEQHLSAAAESLSAGDVFLLSYAGHGAQMPDTSGDESDHFDETWCLFDGQLVDDDFFRLLAEFSAGVRIIVVSDSCHSGSVTRSYQGLRERAVTGIDGQVRYRNMPREVAVAIARSPGGLPYKGPPGTSSASIRLLAACQDNQLAAERGSNGLYTRVVVDVWDSGRFCGSYKEFHRTIVDRMPPTQSPGHCRSGVVSPAFDAQRPFEI